MRAVIFDIDGTLANVAHRRHFVTNGNRDWDSFFANMSDDPVNVPIEKLLCHLHETGNRIILSTGRGEEYRAQTEAWLVDNDITFDQLYMRPAGDSRPDHVVKREMLGWILKDGYEPWLVVDDRPSVVRMWREEGLTCLQCADWDGGISDTTAPGRLTLMVGPSGAGKSTFVAFSDRQNSVLSSDDLRLQLCGDFRDQSKNEQVFKALHALTKTRLENGLDVIVDATNIRNRDRRAFLDLAPPDCEIVYRVVDRPLANKRATGGWRNALPGQDLIGKHHEVFQQNLKDILAGDNDPRVTVVDLRGFAGCVK